MYTITKAQAAAMLTELSKDARFTAETRKEIGQRIGRPDASGLFHFTPQAGPVLATWANGIREEAAWYEPIVIANATKA